MLHDYLLLFAQEAHPNTNVLQQDWASIHKAYTVTTFLKLFLSGRDGLAGPDLNPVEKVWGILARVVYRGHHQFDHVSDLQEAIL